MEGKKKKQQWLYPWPTFCLLSFNGIRSANKIQFHCSARIPFLWINNSDRARQEPGIALSKITGGGGGARTHWPTAVQRPDIRAENLERESPGNQSRSY